MFDKGMSEPEIKDVRCSARKEDESKVFKVRRERKCTATYGSVKTIEDLSYGIARTT